MRKLLYGLVFIGSLLLVGPVLYVLLAAFFGTPLFNLWDEVSFDSFRAAANDSSIRRAALQSISLGLTSATIGVLGSLIIVPYRAIYRLGDSREYTTWLMMPISFPDVIWGLGLLVMLGWVGAPGGGFLVVLLVHSVFNLALACAVLKSRMSAVPRARIDAGRDLGGSFVDLMRVAVWPAIDRSTGGAWCLCFIFSLDDFVLTYLLGGTGVETIPLWLYGRLRHGMSEAAVGVGGLTVLLSIGLLVLGSKLLGVETRES